MTAKQIQDKAIIVIEALTLMWENGPQTKDRAEAFISGIYRYAHLARGGCKNPHADWLVELNQTYESFIKLGVIARLDEVEE